MLQALLFFLVLFDFFGDVDAKGDDYVMHKKYPHVSSCAS